MVQGEGILHYSRTPGLYRLVVDIDPAIIHYYRSLVPREINLNRQKFPPHVTVVREGSLPSPSAWGAYEGERLVFDYIPTIRVGDVYFWLEVYSIRLGDIRAELGLERIGPNARPPDDKDCFHTTLGNLRVLV